jgi:hypothetical protein
LRHAGQFRVPATLILILSLPRILILPFRLGGVYIRRKAPQTKATTNNSNKIPK